MIGGTGEAAAVRQYVTGWYCADCSCDAGADQVDIATVDTLLADIEDSPETGICCNCDNRFKGRELKWFWVEIKDQSADAVAQER